MTREEWLNAAVGMLNHLIATETDLTPASKIQISTAWPRNDRRGQVIGQCYQKKASKGWHNIFVTPTLGTARQVLPVILHELIHAADDCEHHHAGAFRKAWRDLGFQGKPTESDPGPELRGKLLKIAMELPEYPHQRLDPGADLPKKQSTRMLKLECPSCGYVVRTTKKWLEVGLPTCFCGREFEEK